MQIPCVFYYYGSVVQPEVRDGDTSRSSFLGQDCFNCPGLFVYPHEAEYCPFKVCKELCFDGDDTKSLDCF